MLGVGALLVSAVGAWNSLRKGRLDERSGTNAELQALNRTYREEIERLETKLDTSEEDCRTQIQKCADDLKRERERRKDLEQTILEQAERLSQLERRAELGTKTRRTDGEVGDG